jgi:Domain of unknown function (DUF4352)
MPSIDCTNLILRGTAKSRLKVTPLPRVVFLAVGAVIISIVVGALYSTGVVTTPFSSSSSSDRIQVEKVWMDNVDSANGQAYYLVDVNASNSGLDIWRLNPAYFSLSSNNSATYEPSQNYSETSVLQNSTIGPEQQTSGEVVFQLPATQSPSKLTYSDPTNGVQAQTSFIPAVSATATKFDPSVHFVLTGAPWAPHVETWAAITNQTSGLAFFGGEDIYKDNTFVFFSGQKIGVTFFFDYFKTPTDPTTISVQSVTNQDGYQLSELAALQTDFGFNGYRLPHPLPVNMMGYGSNADLTLLVTVPQGHLSGVLHFTVQFSA